MSRSPRSSDVELSSEPNEGNGAPPDAAEDDEVAAEEGDEAKAETGDGAAAEEGEAPAETPGDPGEPEARPGLGKAAPEPTGEAHLKSVLESLLFAADQPVTPKHLAKVTRSASNEVRRLLGELVNDYEGRGIELVEVGTGWQFRTAAANAPFVRDFVKLKPVRLSRAQLETLAIVAYRQPVTRPEVEDVRGVDSGSAIKVLADRNLVKIIGRKDEPGRPLLYGTTPTFLEFFGLKSLKDLPTLQEFSELSEESRVLFERKMGEPMDLQQGADGSYARGEAGDSEPPDSEPPTDSEPPEEQSADAETAGEGAVDAAPPESDPPGGQSSDSEAAEEELEPAEGQANAEGADPKPQERE